MKAQLYLRVVAWAGETNKLNLEHSQLPPPYTPVSLAFLLLTDDRQTDWGRGEGGTIVVKMFM